MILDNCLLFTSLKMSFYYCSAQEMSNISVKTVTIET